MIISKKRFKEEIAKAVNEAQDRMYQDRRINDMENALWKEIHILRERVDRLDFTNGTKCKGVYPIGGFNHE